MELSGILSFIGLFVLVLSALVGVAYYSLKESPEETSVDSGETKKNLRKTKKRDASKKQTEKPKKRKNSDSSNTEHFDAPEEEPIVIIPDPFTNKLSSRFAGAQPKKLDSHKKQNDDAALVHKPVKTEAKVEAKADKVKPQATVKPSKVAEPVVVEKKTAVEQKQESELQVQAMVAKSNEVEKLNLKIKEMEKALNEKLTNVNQLNRQNEEFKIKLDDARKSNAKIQSEFDAQKQTNQVIQKELTRLTTLVSSLDKEKLQLRHELELVRVQQSKPIENTDTLVVRIEQLSNELADRNNSFNQLKSKNQDLESRLVDSNEQNSNMYNRLQTQEALIKQLEIKLERSVPIDTYKQKETDLSALRIELKSLQSQIESLRVYGCQKDSEINCLRAKIDELESQLKGAEENKNKLVQLDELRNQLETSEARIKNFQQECDELKAQCLAKDNQLLEFRSELDQKTTQINSLEAQTNQLKSQQQSQTEIPESSEQIKILQDDLNAKKSRIEILEQELGTFRKKIEQEANTFNEQIKNIQNELNSKSVQNEALEKEIGQMREKFEAELNQSRDQLGQKESELESVKCEMNKLRESGNQADYFNERIGHLESTLGLKQTQLDESFNHVQHLNKVLEEKNSCIGEKQRQLDESFNHVQHLNHVISEKQRQLDESFNHVQQLNKVMGEKDDRLNQLNQVEQQIGHLKEENQLLKQQIQSLEELNSKVEQLSRQNDELMSKNLSLTSTLEQTATSLNCLEELIINRETDLKNEIKKKDHLIEKLNKKNGSNGHHVGDEVYRQLEELKCENEKLKNLLEEEIKSSKASLNERAKIRDLIKIGQDALEHEKLEFLERIDNKLNGSNGH